MILSQTGKVGGMGGGDLGGEASGHSSCPALSRILALIHTSVTKKFIMLLVHMRYEASVGSRWLDIGRVFFWHFYGPRLCEKSSRYLRIIRMTCLLREPGKKANCVCRTTNSRESFMFSLFSLPSATFCVSVADIVQEVRT